MMRKNSLFTLFCAALALCLCACGKDSSPAGEEAGHIGEPVEIDITSGSVAPYGELNDDARTRVADEKNRISFTQSLDDEYDLKVTIAPAREEVPVPTRAFLPLTGTMHIVACDAGGNIVSQCAYYAVKGDLIPLGEKLVVPYSTTAYTFHCFTPANALDVNTKKVVINETDNFNYASTTAVINSTTGTQRLALPTMKPMMSKLKYAAGSEDFPGEFLCAGTISGNFGSSATWTLGNSSLTTTGTAGKTISFSANNEEKLILSGVSTGDLTLTMSNLSIGGKFYGSPAITSVDGITLLPGKIYTVTIEITSKDWIKVAGIKWAKGNLDYSTEKGFFIAPTPDKVSGTTATRQVRGSFFRWMAPYPQNMQSSPSEDYPTQTMWSVTIPNWSGNANDLGNYNYYKNYTVSPSFNASTMTVATLGDPCTALGAGWRMPTYNELYLLCYVSPNANPSGTFGTARSVVKNLSSNNDMSTITSYPTSDANKWYGAYLERSATPNLNPAVTCSAPSTDFDSNKHLFLPAAGFSIGSPMNYSGSTGLYWCSTPYSGHAGSSFFLYITGGFSPHGSVRNYGFSVRCLLE